MLAILALLLGVSPSDLGRPRFHDREEAHAKMVQAWPISLPLLIAGTQDADPEVRWRAERILRKLMPIRGLLDPDVRALLTGFPDDARQRVFAEPNKFAAMMDAGTALGIVDRDHIHIPPESWAVAWLLAARAEALRRGIDPELSSGKPPVIPFETYEKDGMTLMRWERKK